MTEISGTEIREDVVEDFRWEVSEIVMMVLGGVFRSSVIYWKERGREGGRGREKEGEGEEERWRDTCVSRLCQFTANSYLR